MSKPGTAGTHCNACDGIGDCNAKAYPCHCCHESHGDHKVPPEWYVRRLADTESK